MNSKRNFIILLMSLLVSFSSCNNEEVREDIKVEQRIDISEKEITKRIVFSEDNVIKISFDATDSWKASVKDSEKNNWIELEQTAGTAGKKTITVKIKENESYDERSGEIILICGNDKKIIPVVQKQKNALILTSNNLSVEGSASKVRVEVRTNVKVKYEIKDNWIEVADKEDTRALVSNVYEFNVDANEGNKERVGKIVFYNEADKAMFETVTVTQKATEKYINIEKTDYAIDHTESTVEVPFQTNSRWEASVSDAENKSWIKLSKAEGDAGENSLTLKVSPNTTYDERSAEIVLVCGKIQKTITVTQNQKDAIIITSNNVSAESNSQIINVEVRANVKVRYEIKANWIKLAENTDTRGLVNTTYSFSIEANNGDENRTGEIVFYNEKDNSKSEKVTITQKYLTKEITLEKDSYVVTSGASTLNVQFNVNAVWSASITGGETKNWIRLNNTNGTSGSNTLSVSVDENTTHDERSVEIVLACGACIRTISVVQNQKNALILSTRNISAKSITSRVDIEVRANVDVKYEIKNEWIRPLGKQTRGLVSNIYSFTIDENNGDSERQGQIVFSTDKDSNLTETITITQETGKLIIDFENDEARINSGSNRVEFDLRTNAEIKVKSYNYWARHIETRSITNKKLIFDVEENKTGREREAIIIVSDIAEKKEVQLKIKQAPYLSTDFSRDKEVTVLQRHTRGNGINLVITGDGFVDKDLEQGGRYEQLAKKAMESYFSMEPLKSLRDLFTVTSIKAVSNSSFIGSGNTALNSYYGNGTFIGISDYKCKEYAKAALSTEDLTDTPMLIVLNDNKWAGTCHMSVNGFTKSICPFVRDDDYFFEKMVHHEACGHGFGLLGDEYTEKQRIPQHEIDSSKRLMDLYGFYLNVDFTSIRKDVRWNKFLGHNNYYREKVGVYRGGLVYREGVYRPTENSVMRSNSGMFNPPSREAIYKRAMRIAFGSEWNYDFDEFVRFDEKARLATRSGNEEPKHLGKPFVPVCKCCVVEE